MSKPVGAAATAALLSSRAAVEMSSTAATPTVGTAAVSAPSLHVATGFLSPDTMRHMMAEEAGAVGRDSARAAALGIASSLSFPAAKGTATSPAATAAGVHPRVTESGGGSGGASSMDKTALQHKPKGTIGIIGLSPARVALLNKLIIEYSNTLGLEDDQHIPEIISIGIPTGDKRYLKNQFELCCDYGCDVVAIAEAKASSTVDTEFKEEARSRGLDVEVVMSAGEDIDSLRALAKAVANHTIFTDRTRRPPTAFYADSAAADIAKAASCVEVDRIDRGKRVGDRVDHGGYPILKDARKTYGEVVGVLGGAGPLASADLCDKLAAKGVPFIHCSVNGAPGKHRFETGVGPSYIPHYKSVIEFFKAIKKVKVITVPCNTAHRRLEEFCGDMAASVIDIRGAVLTANKNAEGFILLGTNITVGVGVPDGTVGTYEALRRTSFTDTRPFFTPSAEQQAVIMESIYDVKAGRLEVAKAKINGVIEELRKTHGPLPVILGCTELPLPYVPMELSAQRLIDPAQSLSTAARAAMVAKATSHEAASGFVTVGGSGSTPKSGVSPLFAARLITTGRSGATSDSDGDVPAIMIPVSGTVNDPAGRPFTLAVFRETETATFRIKVLNANSVEEMERANAFLATLFKTFLGDPGKGDRINVPRCVASFHARDLSKLEDDPIQNWIVTNKLSVIEGRPPSPSRGIIGVTASGGGRA